MRGEQDVALRTILTGAKSETIDTAKDRANDAPALLSLRLSLSRLIDPILIGSFNNE